MMKLLFNGKLEEFMISLRNESELMKILLKKNIVEEKKVIIIVGIVLHEITFCGRIPVIFFYFYFFLSM